MKGTGLSGSGDLSERSVVYREPRSAQMLRHIQPQMFYSDEQILAAADEIRARRQREAEEVALREDGGDMAPYLGALVGASLD